MRRLNKYITDSGYCSRREADNYITQGRVNINGRVASLGDMVDEMDLVEVDGEKVGHRIKTRVYIACHKPVGVTCTSESSDKTNIVDFIGYKERIFPVGRLDKDSEGLILLTNDGDIVNKILRAGNNNPKEYIVTVNKPITREFLECMASGVRILGVTTKPCKIYRKKETVFVIHLTQGLNRQIRRMCQALGYKVVNLKRVKVLNISLGDLEAGRWRHLTSEEASEMHMLLAQSSGTQEASNEEQAGKAKSYSNRMTQRSGSHKVRFNSKSSPSGRNSSEEKLGRAVNSNNKSAKPDGKATDRKNSPGGLKNSVNRGKKLAGDAKYSSDGDKLRNAKSGKFAHKSGGNSSLSAKTTGAFSTGTQPRKNKGGSKNSQPAKRAKSAVSGKNRR